MGKHTRPLTSAARLTCGPNLHFGPHTMRGDTLTGQVYWTCGNCGGLLGGPAVSRTTDTGTLLAAVPCA